MRGIDIQKMKLLLIAQIQVAQNEVLVRVRGLARNSRPRISRGKLQCLDPQLSRSARVQFQISLSNNEIVRLISNDKCQVRSTQSFREESWQLQSRVRWPRPQRFLGRI